MKTAIKSLAGCLLLLSVGGPVMAATMHTDSYLLGMKIQEGIRTGELSSFKKAFDADALTIRVLAPLKVPDAAKEQLRLAMQPRTTADGVAKVFAGDGRNYAFIGVRRIQDEFCLLFRSASERDALTYCGYVIGEASPGRVTLVDVYTLTPGELLSETIRKQCVLLLANMDRGLLENLEPKYRDLVAAQPQLVRLNSASEAGDNATASEVYSQLPATLKTERFVLFNRTRAAMQSSESDFLAATAPWRDAFPKDPSLEMFASNYYWDKNQDEKSLIAFGRLNDLLEGDPRLDLRIARLHFELHQPVEARARLWQAVQRDPPDAAAFVVLLQDTLSEGNYAGTARALSMQEAAFGVNLKAKVKAEPSYEEFRKSPEYQAWAAGDSEEKKPAAAAVTPTPAKGGLTLQGVMYTPARASALINGKTVFVGDAVAGYKVIKIEPQSVTLQSPAGQTQVLSSKRS